MVVDFKPYFEARSSEGVDLQENFFEVVFYEKTGSGDATNWAIKYKSERNFDGSYHSRRILKNLPPDKIIHVEHESSFRKTPEIRGKDFEIRIKGGRARIIYARATNEDMFKRILEALYKTE